MSQAGVAPENFAERVESLFKTYRRENLYAMYVPLNSHDTPRALTILGGRLEKLKAAFLYLFAYPGAPAVYYGDEIGLEGGNDLVWQPLVRARLGMLDFDWFKREVRYCLTGTGTAGDRTRQIGGRYTDMTAPDYMMRMGIWVENLSLPAVVNECLMQSYTGVMRLFPNAKGLGKARFQRLRAVGAFLVSAAWDGARVTELEVHSERGATARILNPWPGSAARVVRLPGRGLVPAGLEGGVIVFKTKPGETYAIEAG